MSLCLSIEAIYPSACPCGIAKLMFLNAGTVFLIHLSIHTSFINFQSERNGKVNSVDFTVELQ